jgi:uncharacterized membrane protein
MEAIKALLQDFFSNEVVVFILSLLPISEIRGGLIASKLYGMDLITGFLIGYIGNMLPIPFVLLLFKKIFTLLQKIPKIGPFFGKFLDRAEKKSTTLGKYELWGLFALVAIPLPGTGAWTGAMVANVMGMPMKKSLPVIAAGVFAAGIIVSIIMYFIPSLLGL